MNLFFRSSLACLISFAFVASASAIEFEGGILGKLFNGDGCGCKAAAAEPAPTCECPAPEPAPEPEPAPTCCPCVVESAPEPEPEPAPEPTIIYCCPVVEAAPEPEPAPEPVNCCETIVSESDPVVVEAAVESESTSVMEPIETIISEKIIYDGPVVSEVPVSDPAPASAPTTAEPTADIFGPAAQWNVVAPKYRLVFTPKNGWSKSRPTAKAPGKDAVVKTATLKKASGKPTFRLTFATAKATQLAK